MTWRCGQPTQLSRRLVESKLAAAIRVMDQPFGWTPHTESCLQGSDRQPVMQAIINRPANDAAGEQIDDDGQVDSSLPRPDTGDIDAPLLVEAIGSKVLVDDVRRHRPTVLAVAGAFEPALLARLDVVLAH